MTKEQRWRYRLDNWRVWVGIAYFGIALMIVALFFLNRDVTREQTARAATQRAAAVAQLENCYRQVDNNPDLVAIIDAVRLNAENSLTTAKAALAVDPSGPLAQVRRDGIDRARLAIAAAHEFREQILSSTPTLTSCNSLAISLDLPPRDT